MDIKRLILFIALSLLVLTMWQKYVAPATAPAPTPKVQSALSQSSVNSVPVAANAQTASSGATDIKDGVASTSQNAQAAKTILVTTDMFQAKISTKGGDLTEVDLLQHGQDDNVKQPYDLLIDNGKRLFIAQTGLVANDLPNIVLPNHNSMFDASQLNYVLSPNQDQLQVNLTYNQTNGLDITKTYTFHRGSYVVDISYQINNNTSTPLAGVSAYWRLLRDDLAPEGETKFVQTFTGVAYYTNDAKFNTVKFKNIMENDVSYPDTVNNGWIGFIQHYFTAMWLLNPYNMKPVCSVQVQCRFNIKPAGEYASAGFLTDLPTIAAHSDYSVTAPLFVGSQEYNTLITVAPHLELTKDYGWVYIFSTPLFWLLVKLFNLVKNWGWAIILLTVLVKIVLYPLTRASYISMAKMRALAPKIEQLKASAGDDKMKLQKAMMDLYKSEKVNPLGGCLPMLLQIPVFLGLYWALLSSVELRQAPFLWIHDLSRPDPYYILPVILAITMLLQTMLSPTPTGDPVQAKMMKIMPLAFSVMFFFFPAGLVIYWLTNNILSIAQQWYVNNHVTLRHKNRK